MFRTHRVAAALFVGRHAVVGTESPAGACDPATDTCAADAGDDISAMQLNWGKPDEPTLSPTPAGPPASDEGCSAKDKKDGCGKYWELVDVNTLGDTLKGYYSEKGAPYSTNPKQNDPVPWCLQGLVYLDQACTTYPAMPKSERLGPCLNAAPGHFWVNEFVTSFGNWDDKTKCFTAERRGWCFGQASDSAQSTASAICANDGIRACMEGHHKDPCATGVSYAAVDFPFPYTWYFVKTKTGWDRKTPVWWPQYSHYPVHQIVNGTGHKTEWYQYMVDEAMRKTCPEGSEENARNDQKPSCRRSVWADQGKIARCTAPSP